MFTCCVQNSNTSAYKLRELNNPNVGLMELPIFQLISISVDGEKILLFMWQQWCMCREQSIMSYNLSTEIFVILCEW